MLKTSGFFLAAAMAGCLTGWAATEARAAENDAASNSKRAALTYARDVAPIMNQHCVACHRPGEIAPMSMLTYEEIRPWVKSIAKAVQNRDMPPWHADAAHGKFVNDRSLNDKDIDTIVTWINQGARLGDVADLPPTPEFSDGWKMGVPDLIVEFEKVDLPAGGRDIFRDLVASTNLKEDTWIKGVEIRAGNRQVVHHVIVFSSDNHDPSGGQGWVGGWAAGMEPMTFPENSGRLLKKGVDLIANMHYHPTDYESNDVTKVGFYFADEEPEKELINLWVANTSFKIPAGEANHQVVSEFKFNEDSRILSLLPHMHYRGKDFTYTLIRPDKSEEVLLHVPNYDFNWQTVYYPEEAIEAPAGSKVVCVAHFDNSTDNPDNPDPTKDITFGDESYDEMMIGFLDYVVKDGMSPPSMAEVLAKHSEKLMADHAGEVYGTKPVGEDIDVVMPMYFPKAGQSEEGLWYVPTQGTVYEGRIHSIVRLGPGFNAKVDVSGLGTLVLKGIVNEEKGTIKAKAYMLSQEIIAVEGRLMQ